MKRLVVISVDSLLTEDLKYLASCPNFAQLLPQAAVVKNIREIYPTLTYPIHTTLITGVRPETHGIAHNQKHAITREKPDWSILGSDWYWYADAIRVKTLPQAAREAGLITAAVLWPVLAGADVDHNLAEIWPVRADDDLRQVLAKACSPSVMEECFEQHVASLDWTHKPDMDLYGMPCSVDIIRKHKPHLLLQHIICLDHDRHVHGVHAAVIRKTLDRVDGMIGEILQAVRDAGVFEETNFVILGDHGQIDVETVFNLNVLLAEEGLIRMNDSGEPTNYDAYSFSAGFSTQVFLSRPDDPEQVAYVGKVLERIREAWPQYVERIFTVAEASREEGLSGEFSFVVEGTEGTMFHNFLRAPLVNRRTDAGYPYYSAMHGHLPAKGEKPPFLAFGPDIEAGVRIRNGDMLDVCPTLAALLGVELEGMEGEPFPILRTQAGDDLETA